jgi:hypothetical protein
MPDTRTSRFLGIHLPLIVVGCTATFAAYWFSPLGANRTTPAPAHTATAVSRLPVRPVACDQSGEQPGSTAAAVPATVSLAGGTLPAGATLYGMGKLSTVGQPADAVLYMVGPSGQACAADQSFGSDGHNSFYVYLIGPSPSEQYQPQVFVSQTNFPGDGAENTQRFACAYIPAVAALIAGTPQTGNTDTLSCTPDPNETITPMPTGGPHAYIALVAIPPHVEDPRFAASGGDEPVIALMTADIKTVQGLTEVWDVQEIDCAYDTGTKNVCAASLEFFLDRPDLSGSAISQSMTPAARATAIQDIGRRLAAS